MGYPKLFEFMCAIPSYATVEHVAFGDFRARAPAAVLVSDSSLGSDPHSKSADHFELDSVRTATCTEESRKMDMWNGERGGDGLEADEPCEPEYEEGNVDIDDNHGQQEFEKTSMSVEDDLVGEWTESVAQPGDIDAESYEDEQSVEDTDNAGMDDIHSYLLDATSKDLLSVVRRCYRSSRLLKHHQEASTSLQVSINPCDNRIEARLNDSTLFRF